MKKLISDQLINYCLVNSEVFPWLPSIYEVDNSPLLKPGFFIAPQYFVNYQDRENSTKNRDEVDYSYGKLKNPLLYPYILIIEAKSGVNLSPENIGDFFCNFTNATTYFNCFMRGMLFNEAEFILVFKISIDENFKQANI